MPVKRRSYNTAILHFFQQGILPADILALVPYSTRHNWKRRDLSGIIGADDPRLSSANIELVRELMEQSHLRPALVTLLRVNRVLLKTLSGVEIQKKILAGQKEKIIHIVERSRNGSGSSSGDKRVRRHILRWFGISARQFHYWKQVFRPCPASPLKLCRIRHPLQMTAPEVSTIRRYLNNPAFASWTSASIYHRILADGAAFLSISTFYLYVHRLGLSRRFRTFRSQKEGIRGSRPAEILHADITEFRLTDHRKVYIYHVTDNFSRFVFTCRAEFVRSASICLENLEGILTQFPGLFRERFSLIVDDGVENKAALKDFTSQNKELVLLLIAQKDIQFSNSMVEAASRVLKNQYFRDREFATLESLQTFLDEYREDFNSRNLYALTGLTHIRSSKVRQIKAQGSNGRSQTNEN